LQIASLDANTISVAEAATTLGCDCETYWLHELATKSDCIKETSMDGKQLQNKPTNAETKLN
jgi:hypothetical protein